MSDKQIFGMSMVAVTIVTLTAACAAYLVWTALAPVVAAVSKVIAPV